MAFTIVAIEWLDAFAVTIVVLRGVSTVRLLNNILNVVRILSPAGKIICKESVNGLYKMSS